MISQKHLPVTVTSFVNQFIIQQNVLVFLNPNKNYPKDPVQKFTYPRGFGLTTYTQVDRHGFKGLLKGGHPHLLYVCL